MFCVLGIVLMFLIIISSYLYSWSFWMATTFNFFSVKHPVQYVFTVISHNIKIPKYFVGPKQLQMVARNEIRRIWRPSRHHAPTIPEQTLQSRRVCYYAKSGRITLKSSHGLQQYSVRCQTNVSSYQST